MHRPNNFWKRITIGRRVKCNFRAACFKDAYTLDGIVCLPPLHYILMTHLFSSVYTQKPARISAHTCAIVVETRVSTRLARVISKYYRFPREEEPRFCLAGRSFSVLFNVRA